MTRPRGAAFGLRSAVVLTLVLALGLVALALFLQGSL